MRLPFVSRALLDESLSRETHWEVLWGQSVAREAAWAERYERLADKLANFAKPPEPTKLPERSRDDVIDAIIAKSGNNGQIRTHLSAWAMKQRREQVPDAEIIAQVQNWSSPDEDAG